jgi:hypothetical protein
MKKISIMVLAALAACQASTDVSAPVIINSPASDDAASLDYSKLPDGFPVIGEMKLAQAPNGCALSKANRFEAKDGESYADRYVFTAQKDGLYQIGVNGVLRNLKPSQATDMADKKVRYFKTVDGSNVEVQLVTETLPDGSEKGTVSRVKAWDDGFALICAYNRVEVIGDCDL